MPTFSGKVILNDVFLGKWPKETGTNGFRCSEFTSSVIYNLTGIEYSEEKPVYKDLREFIKERPGVEGKRPSPRELQTACVAVLLNTARKEDGLASQEIRQLVAALNREFGITDVEAGELIEIAELLMATPGKLAEFKMLLRDSLTVDEKQMLVAYAWKIIESDGYLGDREAEYATQLRKDLNLTMEQAFAARQMMAMAAEPNDRVRPEE